MLKSTKIDYLLLLDQPCLDFDSLADFSSFELMGLRSLAGQVKCFSSNFVVDAAFTIRCVRSGLFDSLVELEMSTESLDDLAYLNQHCASLKVFRWSNRNIPEILPDLSESRLRAIVNELRTDLSVYLNGIQLNKQSAMCMPAFFRRLRSCIQLPENHLQITIDSQLYRYLNSSIRKYPQLSGFFSQIEFTCLHPNVPMDGNCPILHFLGGSNFEKFLDAFTDFKAIYLHPISGYGNELLVSIARKATNLELLQLSHQVI